MKGDFAIILGKELRRIFTDRKLIMFLVVIPMVMLPLIYTFMGRANRSRIADIEGFTPGVAVLMPHDPSPEATEMLSALESADFRVLLLEEGEQDSAKALVSSRELELVVELPGEDLSGEVTVFHNSTSDYSRTAMEEITLIAGALNDSLVRERVAGYGLPPGILTAVRLNSGGDPGMYDLAREGDLMGKIIGMMVPFFIVIYLFANAMKVGLDTVAGEKERGTLATLLVNRVGRISIVMGKMLSVMVAAIVGALSSMAGLKIASRQIIGLFSGPGEVPGGYAMTAADLLQFAVVVIPLAILVASVVMTVSTVARNVKEGQGMITPVYIAVMVIGTTTMQSGDVPPRWMCLVPVFSSLTVMKQIFMDASTWDQTLFAGASSLVLSAVLILLTVRMFNDERILFRL